MSRRKNHTSPQIRFLKTSAGAGKTYQLTIRFLSLLEGVRPSAEALRGIVAITFTNRAAVEMKDRIVLALKGIALGQGPGRRLGRETGLRPQEASVWLDVILAHFGDFHVRTIDSLVYALVRALSLEMGLRPDLEVVFEEEPVLDRCFDGLLSSARWGDASDRLYRLFSELLETYLEIEGAGGMVVEKGIRRRLHELYERADGPLESGPKPDLRAAEAKLRLSAENLRSGITECGFEGFLHKGIFKPQYLQDPLAHVGRGFFEKASIGEALTKKFQGVREAAISWPDSLYREVKSAREDYLHLLAAARVHSYMRALEELRREVRGLSQREGLIIGGEWLHLVKEFLREGGEAAPYAFLKLGSRVNHFLIDEFQDTSRPQWAALFPLLEETLSKGGTLFYAGDVKQAIYGWRGGDSRLFGEVAEVHFPSVPPEGRRGETLRGNYRSLVKIVDFNNELYRLLGDRECVDAIARMILGQKAPQESREYLSHLISRTFADVEQEAAPHLKDGEKGEIRICSFLAPAEQLRREVRQRLIGEMKGVWERRKEGIAVLVRRNRDAEDITAWLMAEGIPVVTENSLRLRSSDLLKGLVAFLRFLDYPLDDLSFWGSAASRLFKGLPGLSGEDLDPFLSEGRWQPPLYKAFEGRFPAASKEYMRPLLARVGLVTPYDLAREVIERFRLVERFPEDGVFIYRFLELMFQMEARGQRSLSHFLRFWEEGGMEEKIGLPDEISAVRILTIHKAKGLEFPVVFIPFTNWRLERPRLARLHDGSFVSLKRPLPQALEKEAVSMMIADGLEALNLLYVATTRAEEELYLYVTCLPHPLGEGVDRGYLSAWLREMLIRKGWVSP
jgi:ATP-dependent exoDNAse (exonuclease V) beta subunit